MPGNGTTGSTGTGTNTPSTSVIYTSTIISTVVSSASASLIQFSTLSASTSSIQGGLIAPPVPTIVNFTLNEVYDISGAQSAFQQGTSANGTTVTTAQFSTTTEDVDMNIVADLSGAVISYYDNGTDPTSPTSIVLAEIADYAAKIQCSDFQGKGTIDDYSILFQAASKIADETAQMNLAVDVTGFNEFGQAADDLSALFKSFIVKLNTVSVINDLAFLRSISVALRKIWNLSEIFGKFKETILATSAVEIPKSTHDATLMVQNVMSNVNCAMTFINHFVDGNQLAPSSANLSDIEKGVIASAVGTINTWSTLCMQGVNIAMSNSPDMSTIFSANTLFSTNAKLLSYNTSTLRSKLAMYSNI